MKKYTIDQKTMTTLKSTFMLYALNKDYFSYGTSIEKRKDGKYKVTTMEGTWYYTLKDLAYEWDLQDVGLKHIIINNFENDILILGGKNE